MEKLYWKNIDIKPHNIMVACTSYPDYDMSRQILLQTEYDTYIVLEGSHCSCYDFDDTEWEAIAYSRTELNSLASAEYNQYDDFWKQVREQLS